MRLPPDMAPGLVPGVIPGTITRWRGVALSLAAGVMGALGQAPFDLWWLSVAGFALLLILLRRSDTPRQAAWVGWLAGTGYFALALFWIIEPFLIDAARHGWMAPFALVGMAGGLALFWGFAGWVTHALGASALAWIAAVASVEVARSYVLTGFPWALPGHIWIDTSVIHAAALVGHHGLTLLTLAAAAGLVLLVTPARRWWGAGCLAMVAAIGLWGGTVIPDGDATAQGGAPDRPIIRMVQPNAPQHLKWDRDAIPLFFWRQVEYTAAPTDDPDRPRPDLILWAETALSVLLENAEPELAAIADAADGVPVVLGIQRFVGQRTFNSALYLDESGVIRAIYDKHRLVPFGEYMPFGEVMARFGIHGMAASRGGGFSPGPGARLMALGALGHALPLICYEAVFPDFIHAAPARPDFLMQITNDAWFGELSGPYQHLAQARLRAVEQGLPFVRVANTGVSAMIDPYGRITAALPLNEAGWLDAALPLPLPPTLYARTGEAPVLALIAAMLAFAAGLHLRRRRPK
jgi:apolipoprotein N-acyltransferase